MREKIEGYLILISIIIIFASLGYFMGYLVDGMMR